MSEFGMRPSIEFMRKYFKNKPVRGVELGVYKGKNAERFLSMLNIEYLDLIDLWETPPYVADKGRYEQFFEDVKSLFRNYINVKLWRANTTSITQYFEDESLDFVYVDADHLYEGCKRDLDAWYPKLKKGGLIIVHDYYCCEGVNRAVYDFVMENNIKVSKVFDAIGIYDKVKYGEGVIIK